MTEAGGGSGATGSGAPGAGAGDDRPVLVGEVEEPGAGFGRGSFRLETRTWTWGDEDVRRGLPWIGVFLVVFGAILLLGQAVPDAHVLGSALTTALGVALLVSWATGRGWGLYPGLLITAYSLPGLLVDLGVLPGRRGLRDVPVRGRPARGRGHALEGATYLGLAAGRRRDPGRGRWLGTWPGGSTRACLRSVSSSARSCWSCSGW